MIRCMIDAMRTTLLAVLALCAPACGSPDDALVSAFTLPLNGAGWTATSSAGIEVRATVPGDLISDLETAGVVGPTWLDLNWQADSAVWDLASWTYSTAFPVAGPLLENYADAWLVLDSIKMTANVTLNGVALGMPTNQHRRYTYSVGSLLKASGNVLEIAFGPTTQDTASDASGNRFMGCSGGWDWCVGGTPALSLPCRANARSAAAGLPTATTRLARRPWACAPSPRASSRVSPSPSLRPGRPRSQTWPCASHTLAPTPQ